MYVYRREYEPLLTPSHLLRSAQEENETGTESPQPSPSNLPKLLYFSEVSDRKEIESNTNSISEFITGPEPHSNPLSKSAFYSKLQNTPQQKLPKMKEIITISYCNMRSNNNQISQLDDYLVCVALGGGKSRVMACEENFRHMKFIPWGGVCCHLTRNAAFAPPLTGNAFCFLPLPVKTGFNIHVNGYFELSANRRDIWIGGERKT